MIGESLAAVEVVEKLKAPVAVRVPHHAIALRADYNDVHDALKSRPLLRPHRIVAQKRNGINKTGRSMTSRSMVRSAKQAAFAVLAAVALTAPLAADAQQRARAPHSSVEADDERPSPNQTRPLPEIVARVQATPPYSQMDYIGVAGFEMRSMVYVLRFLDGRQVVVVHVDARSGRIVRRAP